MRDGSGRETASEDPAAAAGYWAFLSYSHRDAAIAAWLHRALETWPLPAALVGRPIAGTRLPRRLFPIFRDQEELPTAPDLGAAIRAALDRSRTLIVLCSPAAAASRWVQAEVAHVHASSRGTRILAVLLEGEPNAADPGRECLPPGLRGAREPLAADLRPGGDSRRLALLKLVAGILGIGLGELRQRDRLRRRRRRLLGMVGGAGLLSAGALGWAALADAGLDPPFAVAIRALIDDAELSVYRAVPSRDRVVAGTDALRAMLRVRLGALAAPGGQLEQDRLPLHEVAQITAALFLDSAMSGIKLGGVAEALERSLAPGLALLEDEIGGRRAGAAPLPAEPVLWAMIALTAGLSLQDALDPADRERMRQRLDAVQRIAEIFHPEGAQGWNLLSRQAAPRAHSVYVTALAVQALSALRKAGIGWRGDAERSRLLLWESAGWLVELFLRDGQEGWRRGEDDDKPPDLNLSLFVLGALGCAAEAGVPLPATLRGFALPVLAGLARREPEMNSQEDMVEQRAYLAADGSEQPGTVQRRLLWHPWSVQALARWGRIAAADPGLSGTARLALRRAEAHVVLGLGPVVAAQFTKSRLVAWVPAEALVGIASAR